MSDALHDPAPVSPVEPVRLHADDSIRDGS